ncbi:MAG: site-2 protease family protein [Oscillospiraceae bacterium]
MPFELSSTMLLQWFVRLIVAFTALPIHEFAHGFVADKLGDHTARYQGRLNINPFTHMDMIGTVCLVLTGFGWGKPVQINPRNFKNPKTGMAISAAAGPLSNLIMAFITLVLYKVVAYLPFTNDVLSAVSFMLSIMTTVNISLAIFNLIPIPPLDGSRILNLFLPERIYFAIMRYEMFIFIGLFVVLWTGVLDGPLYFLNNLILRGLDFLTGFVDLIAQLIMHI